MVLAVAGDWFALRINNEGCVIGLGVARLDHAGDDGYFFLARYGGDFRHAAPAHRLGQVLVGLVRHKAHQADFRKENNLGFREYIPSPA